MAVLLSLGVAGCYIRPDGPRASDAGAESDLRCNMAVDFYSQPTACDTWGYPIPLVDATMTRDGAGLALVVGPTGQAGCSAYSSQDLSQGVEIEIIDTGEVGLVFFKLGNSDGFTGEYGLKREGTQLGLYFDTTLNVSQKTYNPMTMRWWKMTILGNVLRAEYRADAGPYLLLGDLLLPDVPGRTFVSFDVRGSGTGGNLIVRNLAYCP